MSFCKITTRGKYNHCFINNRFFYTTSSSILIEKFPVSKNLSNHMGMKQKEYNCTLQQNAQITCINKWQSLMLEKLNLKEYIYE